MIVGHPIVMLNKDELVYYSCNMFVVFNMLTKEYYLIEKNKQKQKLCIGGIVTPQDNHKVDEEDGDIYMMKKIQKWRNNNQDLLS